MSFLVLIVSIAGTFVAALILLEWFLAESNDRALTLPYEKLEAAGPAAFWPRASSHKKPALGTPAHAAKLFQEGCPCEEALLAAYGPALGISRGQAFEMDLRLAHGIDFAETCGAVTGGLTLVALARVHDGLDSPETRREIRQATSQYLLRFQQRWGAVNCRELLGHDIRTPEGLRLAREEGAFTQVCPKVVRDAAALVDEVLNDSAGAGNFLDVKNLRAAAG